MNLNVRLFISCSVIGSLTPISSVAFKKMANSPDIKYSPEVMPISNAPVQRSLSDNARETFLNKLEQRVSAKLDDIDGGRVSVSKQPFFMSYGKRNKPLFAEYGKRSFPGLTSLWARNFNSYQDLH